MQLDLIEEVFNLFDTDGQQQLDEEELASAIFTLGFSQNSHMKLVPYISLAGLKSPQGSYDVVTLHLYNHISFFS